MILARFKWILKFSGNKIKSQNFLHRGQNDPRPMTSGARGPYDRPAWPARPEQPGHGGLLQVSMEAALRCGKRRGTGSSRTLGSPGALRRGQLGRRRAGGDEFGSGELGIRRGNRRLRWRFEVRGLDSSYEETEDGEAHLLGTSTEAGEERNGKGRRRPWRAARATGRFHGRERGASQGEKIGRGGSGVACRGVSRGSSWCRSGKQEVAVLGPAQDTQELAVSAKKTTAVLQIAPWLWGFFWRLLKTAQILQNLLSLNGSRNYEISQSLSC
jgi:hypothetical protein